MESIRTKQNGFNTKREKNILNTNNTVQHLSIKIPSLCRMLKTFIFFFISWVLKKKHFVSS